MITIYHKAFISDVLIALSKDNTSIDFGFTRSKVKVTMATFVKNVNMVFAHYLRNFLSQNVIISHGVWFW